MIKKCFKCGLKKRVEFFYKHKQMADGLLGKCKSCAKKDVKNRYNNQESFKKIQAYEAFRFKDPIRKLKLKEYQRKRRNSFKGKFKARTKTGNAIRDGRLVRLPCEVCGEIKSQAHHDDYRKPLDVRWLCFKHHRELHGQTIRT